MGDVLCARMDGVEVRGGRGRVRGGAGQLRSRRVPQPRGQLQVSTT
jgi:hypothetical protein